MNVFNRVVMVLIVLLVIVAVVFVAVYPLETISLITANLNAFREAILASNSIFAIFMASSGAIVIVGLVILWLELRSTRRRTVRIKTQGAGNAQLDVQSVAQSLEYRIDELAGVRKVQPRIVSRGKDVEVSLDLDTSPSVNIAALTDQVVNLSQEIVEKQLGLKLRGRINVRIRHEPYPRGTMPVSGEPARESVIPPASPAAKSAAAATPQPSAAAAPAPAAAEPAAESLFAPTPAATASEAPQKPNQGSSQP